MIPPQLSDRTKISTCYSLLIQYENHHLKSTEKITNLVQVCSCYKPDDRNADHHNIWQKVWILYPDMARKHLWKMVMRPGKPATN